METVRDDPDRDEIISRHMGWDRGEDDPDREPIPYPDFDDDDADNADDADFDPSAIEAEAIAEVEAEKEARKARADDDDDDPFGDDSDLKAIPAYRLAFDIGLKVHEALQPYMKARTPEDVENWDRDEVDERMSEAYIGCMITSAKIAGGHAMGYEDHVLCGNIANIKRGLAGADQCEKALVFLKNMGALPADLVEKLIPDVHAVQQAVRERIEELRKRVWW
jgi:hypothetical protein